MPGSQQPTSEKMEKCPVANSFLEQALRYAHWTTFEDATAEALDTQFHERPPGEQSSSLACPSPRTQTRRLRQSSYVAKRQRQHSYNPDGGRRQRFYLYLIERSQQNKFRVEEVAKKAHYEPSARFGALSGSRRAPLA